MAEAPKKVPRGRTRARRSAVDRVQNVSFPVVMRGYDRQRVDRYVAEVVKLVTELESTQLRETVVQSALDEVGEQTSGILQRARQTADEIEAQSWSQAEGRLQRAEREAESARSEAERYAEDVAADTRALWQQRQRLIEEMRQLADEVLGVADDALERIQLPSALEEASEAGEEDGYPANGVVADQAAFGLEDLEAAEHPLQVEPEDGSADEGIFADDSRPGPEEEPVEEAEAEDESAGRFTRQDPDDATAKHQPPEPEDDSTSELQRGRRQAD